MFQICPLSSESLNLSSIFRNCPLFFLKCPLFRKVRGFTLDRMDLGSEPKKKRRHKKLATKVSFKVENFLSSTISEKNLLTLIIGGVIAD